MWSDRPTEYTSLLTPNRPKTLADLGVSPVAGICHLCRDRAASFSALCWALTHVIARSARDGQRPHDKKTGRPISVGGVGWRRRKDGRVVHRGMRDAQSHTGTGRSKPPWPRISRTAGGRCRRARASATASPIVAGNSPPPRAATLRGQGGPPRRHGTGTATRLPNARRRAGSRAATAGLVVLAVATASTGTGSAMSGWHSSRRAGILRAGTS
jgi:hypothetical protein